MERGHGIAGPPALRWYSGMSTRPLVARYLSLRPGASARLDRLFGEEGCCTRERPLSRQPYALWGPLPPQRQRHRGKRQSGGRGRGLGAARRRVAIFITSLTLRALPDNAAKPRLRGRGGQWMPLCGVRGRSATGLADKQWNGPLNISGVRSGATMGSEPHGALFCTRAVGFRYSGLACAQESEAQRSSCPRSSPWPRPIKAHQRVASNDASAKRTPQKQQQPHCMSGRPHPRALRLVARLPMLLLTVLSTIRHAPAARALLQPEPQVRGVAPAVGAPHVRRP